jgi:hypothetical protein
MHKIILLIILLFTYTISTYAADSYVVASGTTVTIDEHGVCRDVTNNHASSLGIMVPTRSANEWHTATQSFLVQLSSGVTAASCAATCAGTLVGGYCWYYSQSDGQDCDAVCSPHGGCNLTGTRNYAGSGGTIGQCDAVLTAVGAPSPGSIQNFSNPNYGGGVIGCSFDSAFTNTRTYEISNPTTCNAPFHLIRRACACNN